MSYEEKSCVNSIMRFEELLQQGKEDELCVCACVCGGLWSNTIYVVVASTSEYIVRIDVSYDYLVLWDPSSPSHKCQRKFWLRKFAYTEMLLHLTLHYANDAFWVSVIDILIVTGDNIKQQSFFGVLDVLPTWQVQLWMAIEYAIFKKHLMSCYWNLVEIKYLIQGMHLTFWSKIPIFWCHLGLKD